jgi:hypothetical protein
VIEVRWRESPRDFPVRASLNSSKAVTVASPTRLQFAGRAALREV